MQFLELSNDNFIFFAINHYDNPTASTQEDFEEDLKRFKYLKRWFKKYHESNDINVHLVLNHMMIIYNCWHDAAVPMLFHKIDDIYWPYLKAYLEYLNLIPDQPKTPIHLIPSDINIKRKLYGTV